MSSKRFEEALKNIPKSSKRFSKNSLNIINNVHTRLGELDMSILELSHKLHVTENEVNAMLSPLYNFSLREISKIEAALDFKIIK